MAGESPLSASPYEVLGVAATASHDQLRRAYRQKLRETHPDTGGAAIRFHAVQHAWELIGTPEARARLAGWAAGAEGALPTAGAKEAAWRPVTARPGR